MTLARHPTRRLTNDQTWDKGLTTQVAVSSGSILFRNRSPDVLHVGRLLADGFRYNSQQTPILQGMIGEIVKQAIGCSLNLEA